jgi:hypothetical protein
MFFRKCLKISSVILVAGFTALCESNIVVAQSLDQVSAEDSQLSPPGKEISIDSTKNRISASNQRTIQPLESTAVNSPSAQPVKAVFIPKLIPFQRGDKLSQLEKAYLDVFTILTEESECSRLYGGARATMALNELVRQLKPTHLDRNTGVRMYGSTTTVQHSPTGFSFRTFGNADINLSGPFYRGNVLNEPHVPSIGRFSPNTREARVTLLLHELGHMVKGPDNRWLLPDDGSDPELSHENTFRVVSACGKQIESLSKLSVAAELLKAGGESRPYDSVRLDARPLLNGWK